MALWSKKGRFPGKTGENQVPPVALDRALAAWREAVPADERLSAEAHQAVLQAALEPTHPVERHLAPLFLPVRKLLLAGVLPAVVLTLAVGWLARPAEDTTPVAAVTAPPVHVTKYGDEVIFLIANGTRPHAVYKSTAPNRFDAPPAFWTRDGSFRDRLDAGPALVFYRID